LPILNILVPQTAQTPWVAGLPFFMVIALWSFISRFARHFYTVSLHFSALLSLYSLTSVRYGQLGQMKRMSLDQVDGLPKVIPERFTAFVRIVESLIQFLQTFGQSKFRGLHVL
jgi:hypothetical protein